MPLSGSFGPSVVWVNHCKLYCSKDLTKLQLPAEKQIMALVGDATKKMEKAKRSRQVKDLPH
jgi:hypothetical protein